MPDMKVTIKVPAQLVTGLQEQGVSDVGTFLESFLRQVEAEDLVEMSQESFWDMSPEDPFDEEEFDEELEELEEDEEEDFLDDDEEEWDEEDDDF